MGEINDVDKTIFTWTNIRAAPGARKRKTRKGRGIAAGQGATCGFGMRGQKSRSGRPTRPGFEEDSNHFTVDCQNSWVDPWDLDIVKQFTILSSLMNLMVQHPEL